MIFVGYFQCLWYNTGMLKKKWLVGIGIVLAVGVAYLLWLNVAIKDEPIGNEPVYCTQEVKQCPDGSYVGRSGPKCEFAPCPNELLD